MRIRCERCATIYELDEKRLPAHGALVKCTRCDHVFRAAPPPPGEPSTPQGDPGSLEGERPPAEERTALFGFSNPGAAEHTASLASAPDPISANRGEPAGTSGAARAARPTPPATRAGSRWQWMLVAALLAALALALGWYVLQSRAATPTTRLPAGAVLLPT